MKTRTMTTAFLAGVLLIFGIRAAAQRPAGDATQPNQTTQGQSAPGMMGQGGMMGMMGQMQAHHQQMSALMNQLMESMAAMRSETNPEQLKSKLAEHQKLLDEMRSQMMGQGNMMKMMSGQVQQNCPAAGGTDKPTAK
jgi:hypothetical protein